MGPSESSNNSLLFIKYRKIDHGKSIDFFPIIYIQSECRSRSPDVVYSPIFTRFGEKVGLWTKGAEKYPNFGYLENRCHGNQNPPPPELIKHHKGYGILSGGALGGTSIVAMDFCYHGNRCVALRQLKSALRLTDPY